LAHYLSLFKKISLFGTDLNALEKASQGKGQRCPSRTLEAIIKWGLHQHESYLSEEGTSIGLVG
jgi:hypothetical protein